MNAIEQMIHAAKKSARIMTIRAEAKRRNCTFIDACILMRINPAEVGALVDADKIIPHQDTWREGATLPHPIPRRNWRDLRG